MRDFPTSLSCVFSSENVSRKAKHVFELPLIKSKVGSADNDTQLKSSTTYAALFSPSEAPLRVEQLLLRLLSQLLPQTSLESSKRPVR